MIISLRRYCYQGRFTAFRAAVGGSVGILDSAASWLICRQQQKNYFPFRRKIFFHFFFRFRFRKLKITSTTINTNDIIQIKFIEKPKICSRICIIKCIIKSLINFFIFIFIPPFENKNEEKIYFSLFTPRIKKSDFIKSKNFV